ncbi:hypothetical protein MHB54_00510 [Paenibacillus sp. FSL M7-0802]|uniref:hypothetical protein n=1 Tax=Paenibacillus sp. FSL M7-0802 TaxID=2921536 RepID=UPI0030F8E705
MAKVDTKPYLNKLMLLEEAATEKGISEEWLVQVGEGLKLYLEHCLQNNNDATIGSLIQWLEKRSKEFLAK